MEKGAKICPQLLGLINRPDKPGIKYICRKEACGQYDEKLKCCGIVALSRRLENLADAIDNANKPVMVYYPDNIEVENVCGTVEPEPFKKVRRGDIHYTK